MSRPRRDTGDLTAFAIDGPVLDNSQSFMHLFFQVLARDGDGRRIFVSRGVCKRWRALVDTGMDNGHWAMLHACTVEDDVLRRLLLSRSANIYSLAEGDMKAAFRAAVFEGSGGQASRKQGLYLLLNLCKQVAVDAAASTTPRRFTLAFDNELRGLAYYAVWRATKDMVCVSIDELKRWWEETLQALRRDVGKRVRSRPECERAAAELSLHSFVHSMSDIPFHACRKSDEFRETGLQQLA